MRSAWAVPVIVLAALLFVTIGGVILALVFS